jgi:uncharacterized membrane protein
MNAMPGPMGGEAGPGAQGGHLPSDDAPTWTGLGPRTAAVLAYGAWWLTGALFLVLEPKQPFVAFHARQAFRVFGLIWLAGTALWALGLAAVFVSPMLFRVLSAVSQLTWVAGAMLWGACLLQAARGERWRVPGAGWFGT